MGYFELTKKRVSTLMWIIFAIIALIAFASTGGKEHWAIVIYAFLFGIALNINLSIKRIREKIEPVIFFIILVAFAFVLTFIAFYSGNNVLHGYPFLFLILFTGLYFQMHEAIFMALIISCLDGLALYFEEKSVSALLSSFFLGRACFYFLLSGAVCFITQRNNRDLQMLDGEVRKLRKDLSQLDTSHRIMTEEKGKAEKVSETLNRETKQRQILFNISKTLTQTLELDLISSQLLESLRNFVEFQSGGIFLLKKDRAEIYCAAQEGPFQEEMRNQIRDSASNMPGITISKNQPFIINNLDRDPRFSSIIATANVHSAIYFPISIEGEIFGCICLWNEAANSYLDKNLDFMASISYEAARAIKNAELYKALDTRLNFIVALWNTSKNLTSIFDLSLPGERRKVLEKVLETIQVLFEVDGVIFYVYREEQKTLAPVIVRGIPTGASDDNKLYRDSASGISYGAFAEAGNDDLILTASAIEEGKLLLSPIQVSDISVSSRKKYFSSLLTAGEISALFWQPLKGREKIIGALAFLSREPREWTKEESQWADIFCNMFSMSLENISLMEDIFTEKNQLEVLVDSMPEGVFTTDNSMRIITWNKGAYSITGWKVSDVVGSPCSAFIKCQNVDEVKCATNCYISRSIVEGERKESDIESVFVMTRKKERVSVYITAAPIYGSEKKVTGSIFVFRDVTREKEIENMKEEFLATVTHDLKSPLASIMGYSELMTNPKMGELNKNQKEFIQAITRSCKTLQILVSNILTSARMEAGQMRYNIEDFNLNELFTEMYEMFAPITGHKKINLVSQIEKNVIARADREKIKEVLLNLIGNAVKFTPPDGTITLTGESSGEAVRILVSDTGKGIPAEEIPRLFEKFTQLKGEKKGTGLGLYIIKKIIDAHDQKIEVTSEVGNGTKFAFTLEGRISDSAV